MNKDTIDIMAGFARSAYEQGYKNALMQFPALLSDFCQQIVESKEFAEQLDEFEATFKVYLQDKQFNAEPGA